jgi:hypothetical protein
MSTLLLSQVSSLSGFRFRTSDVPQWQVQFWIALPRLASGAAFLLSHLSSRPFQKHHDVLRLVLVPKD